MTRRLIAVRVILLGVCATAMPGLARDALAETYYVRMSGSDSATGLTPANIRKRLRELRVLDLVVQHGGPGLPTTYERTR